MFSRFTLLVLLYAPLLTEATSAQHQVAGLGQKFLELSALFWGNNRWDVYFESEDATLRSRQPRTA